MSSPKPTRALAGTAARWWRWRSWRWRRRPRSPRSAIPWTVAGLARRLDPSEAGVLLAYHHARTGDPGYVPAWFGIAAAERVIRRRGWDRAELLRAGRAELLAAGQAEPTELEARRRAR